MSKTLFGTICAAALLSLPALSHAQVTSFKGRTGVVVPATADYTCAQVTNCPPTNTANTFTATQTVSAASGSGGQILNNTSRSRSWTVQPVNSQQSGTGVDLEFRSTLDNGHSGQVGFFAGYDGRLVVGRGPLGVPNARQYTSFHAMGPFAGENNGLEAMAFDGWQQVALTRYDTSGGSFVPVGSYKQHGAYCFAAYDGTSTNCNAGLMGFTTQTQVHGSAEGAGAALNYTPNGSTGMLPGLTLNAGGLGGLSVGATGGGVIPTDVPADLGNGTVHALSDIATGRHFRSKGAAPTVGSCGSGTTVTGTDAAGYVALGSAVTSCNVFFNQTYGTYPVCLVQTYGAATPVTYVGNISATGITVNFSASYSGAFMYLCTGIS